MRRYNSEIVFSSLKMGTTNEYLGNLRSGAMNIESFSQKSPHFCDIIYFIIGVCAFLFCVVYFIIKACMLNYTINTSSKTRLSP